jgi:hypothetical protein
MILAYVIVTFGFQALFSNCEVASAVVATGATGCEAAAEVAVDSLFAFLFLPALLRLAFLLFDDIFSLIKIINYYNLG